MKLFLSNDDVETMFEIDGLLIFNPMIEKYEDLYGIKSGYHDKMLIYITFKDVETKNSIISIIKENLKEHPPSRQAFEKFIIEENAIAFPIAFLNGLRMNVGFEDLAKEIYTEKVKTHDF